MAIAFQSPSKDCIHYTDSGSQYWSHDYKKNMRQYDFQLAMSDKDNCYDKATVETVFKTIKVELVWCDTWETHSQAEMTIFEYSNGFYNPRRRHSTLGWKSLVVFERKVVQTGACSGTKVGQAHHAILNFGGVFRDRSVINNSNAGSHLPLSLFSYDVCWRKYAAVKKCSIHNNSLVGKSWLLHRIILMKVGCLVFLDIIAYRRVQIVCGISHKKF